MTAHLWYELQTQDTSDTFLISRNIYSLPTRKVLLTLQIDYFKLPECRFELGTVRKKCVRKWAIPMSGMQVFC